MSIADEYAAAVERLRASRVDPTAFAARLQEQSQRRIAMLVSAMIGGAMHAALDDHDPGDEDRS